MKVCNKLKNTEAVLLFKNEMDLLNKLVFFFSKKVNYQDHPNLIKIYDIYEDSQFIYVV